VIDAVVFDFGGVVVSSPFEAIGRVGEPAGVAPEAVLEVFFGDYDQDTDHALHRLERGEIDMATYATDLVQRCEAAGIELDFAALTGLMDDMRVHEEVVDTIRRLRTRGYRTGLLTNNVREAGDEWRAKVPLDELFDTVVDSCQVGMRKPDPRIYALVLEELGGIAPERAVFCDDHPGNVAGAERVGMHALLVTEPAPSMAALEELLDDLAHRADT